MNPYFENSKKLLGFAEDNLKDDISFIERINCTLFFSVGIESLMKGIIYDVNPLYIYIEPAFNNTIPILYKDKIKSKNREKKDKNSDEEKINHKPNEDVINFSKSYHRAEHLSETTHSNKATIFRLKKARDIIVHCLIEELKDKQLNNILAQFKILIAKYEEELDIKFIKSEVNEDEIKQHKLEIETKLQEKIGNSKQNWIDNKDDNDFIKNARINTILMDRNHPEADNSYLIKCPACSQPSVLFVFEDYGMNDYADIVVENIFVKNLSCYFCDFYVEEPEEIDYLKLYEAERVGIDW